MGPCYLCEGRLRHPVHSARCQRPVCVRCRYEARWLLPLVRYCRDCIREQHAVLARQENILRVDRMESQARQGPGGVKIGPRPGAACRQGSLNSVCRCFRFVEDRVWVPFLAAVSVWPGQHHPQRRGPLCGGLLRHLRAQPVLLLPQRAVDVPDGRRDPGPGRDR